VIKATSCEDNKEKIFFSTLRVGYAMGYQSVGIQFGWSVLQNLMHKLPGTTFIFFIG
jgi:hypothetical protein